MVLGVFLSKFLSSPFTIRAPFLLLLGCNKGTLKQKGQKGTTQEPSYILQIMHDIVHQQQV